MSQVRLEHAYLSNHVILNFLHGDMKLVLTGHEKVGWENRNHTFIGDLFTGFRINALNSLNFIAIEINTNGIISISEKDIYRIAFHTEISTFKICLRSAI